MREAMHVLEEVRDPPRPASGKLRAVDSCERDLLAGWMRAFAEEAGVLGADNAGEIVDAQLARGRLIVWDDNGPASVVSISPTVAGVTRIGPVYTPPEMCCHGYASSAVAATSRRALAAGARRCALFTDLANPTSNKIYADVGYRRLAEWEEHAFEHPDHDDRAEPPPSELLLAEQLEYYRAIAPEYEQHAIPEWVRFIHADLFNWTPTSNTTSFSSASGCLTARRALRNLLG